LPASQHHNKHLQRVAQALLENNLTLNEGKCCFAAPAIDFVGFRLSTRGIAPLQSNIDAILQDPRTNLNLPGGLNFRHDGLLTPFLAPLLTDHCTPLPASGERRAMELDYAMFSGCANTLGPAHNTPSVGPL